MVVIDYVFGLPEFPREEITQTSSSSSTPLRSTLLVLSGAVVGVGIVAGAFFAYKRYSTCTEQTDAKGDAEGNEQHDADAKGDAKENEQHDADAKDNVEETSVAEKHE